MKIPPSVLRRLAKRDRAPQYKPVDRSVPVYYQPDYRKDALRNFEGAA